MYKIQMVLLLTVCWLVSIQLVRTQDDLNDNLNQEDNFDLNNFDENSAEIDRQERLELKKLLGKGLIDDVEEKTAPEPTKSSTKLKKPSRKIKGPKTADSEESEESVESAEEDEEEDEEEDPAEDIEYDPWNHQFYDINADGTYTFGYSLPHGVRRYERSTQSIKGLVVEGFYTESRYHQHHLVYELRCYRADYNGYRPLAVEYLERPPIVLRGKAPDVDCIAFN